jgi:bifunctional DNA-binding transcriptional regulator/antitoxin component of YhaV-PrlF toxin-antitoxin module
MQTKIRSIIGEQSFTLPLPKQFAVQLGIGKGDFLDCQIDGNRLIVKKANPSFEGKFAKIDFGYDKDQSEQVN